MQMLDLDPGGTLLSILLEVGILASRLYCERPIMPDRIGASHYEWRDVKGEVKGDHWGGANGNHCRPVFERFICLRSRSSDVRIAPGVPFFYHLAASLPFETPSRPFAQPG